MRLEIRAKYGQPLQVFDEHGHRLEDVTSVVMGCESNGVVYAQVTVAAPRITAQVDGELKVIEVEGDAGGAGGPEH
jgi:hypothetical protein